MGRQGTGRREGRATERGVGGSSEVFSLGHDKTACRFLFVLSLFSVVFGDRGNLTSFSMRSNSAPTPKIRPRSLYTSSNRNLAGLHLGSILSLSFSMVRFHFLSLRRCRGIFVNGGNKIMHGHPASRFYLIVYVPRKVR